MLHFLKNNQAASIFFLPLLLITIWIHGFISPYPPEHPPGMLLYNFFLDAIINVHFLLPIATMILVFSEALLFNRIVTEHEIIKTTTYVPATLYIILISCLPSFLTMHPIVIANLPLLFGLHKLMKTYRKKTAFSEVFDAGFFIAIASLIYFPSIVFVILIWIGLIIIRPFIWREWVISFMGFITPWIFFVFYYLWNNKIDNLWHEIIFYTTGAPQKNLDISAFTTPDIITIGIIIVLGILSIGNLFRNISMGTVCTRNNIFLLIYFTILSALSIFIAPSYSIKYFSFFAIPLAAFLPGYLLFIKKQWLAETIFIFFLLSIIFNQIAG
ncbi:MAG: DUF6427 family protein [Bacteroidota bacterium]